jgi:hypothetical protein
MSAWTKARSSAWDGHALGLEGGEHVLEGGDREHARGELFAALEGVADEVEDGVGELGEGGGGGGELEAAECGDCVVGREHRLLDRAVVDLAVGGEGFGGGGGPDGELAGGGVAPLAGGGDDLEAGGAGLDGGGGEADLDAVVGGDLDLATCPLGQVEVMRAGGEVDEQRGVGLVLQDDREFEAVAEVEEAGGGGADHQGEAGGDRRLGLAEAVGAGDGDGHDAIAGEVVGELDVDAGAALGVGGEGGGEQGEGVEVAAHGDRGAGGAGVLGTRGGGHLARGGLGLRGVGGGSLGGAGGGAGAGAPSAVAVSRFMPPPPGAPPAISAPLATASSGLARVMLAREWVSATPGSSTGKKAARGSASW